MHPLVRDLYRRVLLVGPQYPHPEGLDFVRRKAKAMFRENAELTDEIDIKRCVARGRWYVREEVQGVIKLRKFVRARYARFPTHHHRTHTLAELSDIDN